MKNENKCENCYYFLRHYIKSKTRFAETDCGHCIKKKTYNDFKNLKPCGKWQPQEKKDEETKIRQEKTLAFLANRLNEIAEVLEEKQKP